MKRYPGTFSDAMIGAIREGRKTQDRRVVKLSDSIGPEYGRALWELAHNPDDFSPGEWTFIDRAHPTESYPWIVTCPFGQPGDQFWVPECWKPRGNCYRRAFGPQIQYAADGEYEWRAPRVDGVDVFGSDADLRDYLTSRYVRAHERWLPAVQMPRWASRTIVEITGIRVEQLQKITEEGAVAEGMIDAGAPIDAFVYEWNQINAKRGHPWDANDWVWVPEFVKVESERKETTDEPG